MNKSKYYLILVLIMGCFLNGFSQENMTYAEKLGFPKEAKVVIFHVDDAGMSYESNQGTIMSINEGVATSCSIMMTCPWSASMVKQAINHQEMDAGLHLVLTSEWEEYRWGPLAGKEQVPGLVDKEGNLWPTVAEVLKHASAEEVEKEIRAQIERALTLGLKPTHLDSHMGALFASDQFLDRFIKVGIDYNIPIMFPGGENSLLTKDLKRPIIEQRKKEGKYQVGMKIPKPELLKIITAEKGEKIWDAGFPVLDDLHITSLVWTPDMPVTDIEWGKHKEEKFKEVIEQMKPGLTMVILHSIENSDFFSNISDSGRSRNADRLAITSRSLKKFLKNKGVILTTWKEIMEKRQEIQSP